MLVNNRKFRQHRNLGKKSIFLTEIIWTFFWFCRSNFGPNSKLWRKIELYSIITRFFLTIGFSKILNIWSKIKMLMLAKIWNCAQDSKFSSRFEILTNIRKCGQNSTLQNRNRKNFDQIDKFAKNYRPFFSELTTLVVKLN